MRYFELYNLENLAVCLSGELEKQPANSLPFEVTNLKYPCFDRYPNPSKLVEGVEPINTEFDENKIEL